jgi:hypothetical protein
MNNLLLCVLLLLSLPVWADDDFTLEQDSSGLLINPLEKTDEGDAAGEATDTVPVVLEENPAPEKSEAVVTEEAAVTEPTSESTEESVVESIEEAAPVVSEAPPITPMSEPVLKTETKIEDEEKFNPRKSHWVSTFGFEAMEYNLPFSYTGDKESFKEEKRKLYGGRLGFGGEVYLGAGFHLGAMLEGYYMGTLFESAKTADPEISNTDVAATKDTGQVYGGELVANLSFLWDFKTKNPIMDEWAYLYFEPFIEAGVGKAWGFNKKDYFYDTGSTNVQEEYDQSFNDELTNASIGGGFKITSTSGFFLYLRATQNRYDITKRRQKGYYYADDQSRTAISGEVQNAQMDPVMIYSMGGGYRF